MKAFDSPRPDTLRRPDVEFRHRLRPTERDLIWAELLEARGARRRASGWIGKALVGAVVLMMVFGNFYLAAGALVVGIALEIARQVRLATRIRGLWRALRDPMDGS
jgi:hypothetical protein